MARAPYLGWDDAEWWCGGGEGQGGELIEGVPYNEFNVELVELTGARGFDFDLERDRAAVGRLLELISLEEFDPVRRRLLISALVRYADVGAGPGPGFYDLATRTDLLKRGQDRYLFWAKHVGDIRRRAADGW